MSGSTIMNATFLTALLSSGMRQSVPLIFGSVGDCVSEKSGVKEKIFFLQSNASSRLRR